MEPSYSNAMSRKARLSCEVRDAGRYFRTGALRKTAAWGICWVGTAIFLSAQSVDGVLAPQNCWYTQGGTASRSGHTATRPIAAPFVDRLEYSAEGAIEQEPLVWQENVVLTTRLQRKKRGIQILRLPNLTPRGPLKEIRSASPLVPSIWDSSIVLRKDDHEIAGYKLSEDGLRNFWRLRSKEKLFAPLLYRAEVFTCTKQELSRVILGTHKPDWTLRRAFLSEPVLRGSSLYVLTQSPSGTRPSLLQVNRHTGEPIVEALLSADRGPLISATVKPSLVAWTNHLFVLHANPVLSARGAFTASHFPRNLHSFEEQLLPLGTAFGPSPSGWFGQFSDEQAGVRLLHISNDEQVADLNLAHEGFHDDFLTAGIPASIAQQVAYLGGRAFHTGSGRILSKEDIPTLFRAVPARNSLLLVPAPDKLLALRGEPPNAEATDHCKSENWSGKVVLSGGLIQDGSWTVVDPASNAESLLLSSATDTLHPEQILYGESQEGNPSYWQRTEDALLGLERLLNQEFRDRYQELTMMALAAQDLNSAREYFRYALNYGLAERAVASLQSKIENLGKKPKPIRKNRLAQMEEALAPMETLTEDFYWQRAHHLNWEKHPALLLSLIREILQHDPRYPAAVEKVKTLLPSGLPPESLTNSTHWLDFLEATRHNPVAILPPPEQAHPWRQDLQAFQSNRLLILTSVQNPGGIARCLAMGELTCSALEKIFGGETQSQRSNKLVLHLFENQKEYLQITTGQSYGVQGLLGESAGHYSYEDNLSRIYLPESDDEFSQVMSTYVHELVHHWLTVRCPRFTRKDVLTHTRPKKPAFWIVEGFAVLIQEFQFDFVRRTWNSFDSRAPSLDVLVNAEPQYLHPWEDVFQFSHWDLQNLTNTVHFDVPLTWHLGRVRPLTPLALFYMQAGAACQFLYHADNGRFRGALLDYLTAFHTGDHEGLNLKKAFSMDAEELGRKVMEYARRVNMQSDS